MPNQINSSGLTTKTLEEVVSDITSSLQTIYGSDINTSSDTPDGQLINIFAQAIVDNLDLLTQVYNAFDPDNAIGVTLDQRVAINGIQRLGGTYSRTNITIVVDRACSLPGLDLAIDDPDGTGYTVADNAGNQWILEATQSPATAGTYVYSFRSKLSGAVETTTNTINIPVTIVLGVVSVNNPTIAISTGINQETDSELRLRRQMSVSLSSQGYLAGMLAALKNINGLTDAYIYENTTSSTNVDGVPAHSIWVITKGGASSDIAQAIYQKRNAGCGMYGSQSYMITQVDGSPFIINWDEVVSETLYINFTASSINGVDPINTTLIKNGIVNNLTPDVYETVNVNQLATIVQSIDSNCLVTSAGFSLSGSGPWTNTLTPSSKSKQFSISAINISITVT